MSITAMKTALEALEWAEYLVETSEQSSQEARWAFDAAMPALRTAIAQAEAEIKPLYFVQHPDGSHSVADPQPTAIAEAEKVEPVDWKKCLNEAKMVYSDYLDVQEALHYLEQVFLAAGAQPYSDSTAELSVGDSSFESWYASYVKEGTKGLKHHCRDAYAAGMVDPLVTHPQPAPKQEPVAWEHCFADPNRKILSYTKTCAGFPPRDDAYKILPLYAAPVQAPVQAQPTPLEAQLVDTLLGQAQERKLLTDGEIDEAIQQHVDPVATYRNLHEFARAIEAKIKEQP